VFWGKTNDDVNKTIKRIAIFFRMESFDLKFSQTYKKSPSNVGVSFINKKAPRLGEASLSTV
jgi:hypothetical protein